MVKRKVKKQQKPNIRMTVKSVSYMAILELIVVGLLGAILVINPSEIVTLLAYVLAGFLIIKGIYRVVNYFVMDGQHDFYNNDLFYGMLALLAGILIAILSSEATSLFRIIIGIWIIYAALARFNVAVKLWATKVIPWVYVLLMSLVMLAVGIYVLLSPGAVMSVVGWMMIAVSVLGVINEMILIKHIKEAF